MRVHPDWLAAPVLSLPRAAKRIIVILVDISLCTLTVWLAFYLRLGDFIPLSQTAFITVVASVLIALPVFIVSGLYRAVFRYSGWPVLLAVARAITIYGLIYASVFTAFGVSGVPRTVGIIQPILLLLFVGASRAFARFWLGDHYQALLKTSSLPRVLIYGAGSSGRQLAAALSNSNEMRLVGFLDNDERLHGQVLNGQPVYNPADMPLLVRSLNINDVLLAMPSISRRHRNDIISQIKGAQVSVRTLPSVSDLVQGRVTVSDLRELDIDDLLGREPVRPNQILLARTITDKTVMVTGAGGSIGSELCRQIAELSPARLLLVENSEFALYDIHQELEKRDSRLRLVPLLASVQDMKRMDEIMAAWHPETLFHAAAYKHVPLVEHNLAEGVKNNVLGTVNTAQAAIHQGVIDFVLVSTDKAVRPTNIMGASKRLAEMCLQALSEKQQTTRLSMVRFGNVLGSSGSVVPKFRQQIREGGPVTVTHADMTRYFMTIAEAAQLVIQAGAMAKGGDVFVLDMGESVRILELARRMVALSGLSIKDDDNPGGDIELSFTGLRPGEKLFEELLIGNNPEPTTHTRIMKARDDFMPWTQMETELGALEHAINTNDIQKIRQIIEKLVSGYQPEQTIVDWVYLEQNSPKTGTAETI